MTRFYWTLTLASLGVTAAGFYREMRRARRESVALRNGAASLGRRNQQLAALSHVFSQIASDMSLEHVVTATLRETLLIMDGDMASLRRLRGDHLHPLGAMIRDGRELNVDTVIRLGVGPTGEAVAAGRTLRVERDGELLMSPGDPSADNGALSPSQQSRGARQESGIVVPLVVGSRPIGSLAVWSKEVAHFTEDDERVLEMLGSQVATAIVASSMMEERDRLAHVDALTGLPNRLQLAEDMAGEMATLAGFNRSAVFAMADIDDFKGFNDAMGHSAGDVALQNVGAIMRSAIRPKDHVYRYGGEEFLIVFMDSSVAQGIGLAERLRIAVEHQIHQLRPVTLSIGLAGMPQDGLEPSRLIEKADRALYGAKRLGRNRTVIWSSIKDDLAVA